MNCNFDNITLEKGMYKTGKGFTDTLESLDPTQNYRGTALEGLDAFERQLKRFGIKTTGLCSDTVEKFFQSCNSAVLFPEYVIRCVKLGMNRRNVIKDIIASTTHIDGYDYRPVSAREDKDDDIFYTAFSGEYK